MTLMKQIKRALKCEEGGEVLEYALVAGLIVVAALVLTVVGIGAVRTTPVDALPDLSDVQVIIRTSYPGQAPQIVENQVTYPLATTMLSVPGAKTVRGFSFFGDSFVYVLFEDGTERAGSSPLTRVHAEGRRQ